MSLQALAGRTLVGPEPYTVTPQAVAAYAEAIGSSWDGGPAPVTFAVVVTMPVLQALVDDPAAHLRGHRLVHGEQRLVHVRPILPGDVLLSRLTVESVRSLGATDYLRTVTEIRDENGARVVTSRTTLVHRGSTVEVTSPVPGRRGLA